MCKCDESSEMRAEELFSYINVWYTNIESLTNKTGEFLSRIHEDNPDVICLTETWIQENSKSPYYWSNEAINGLLDGYQVLRRDNSSDIKGGILIFVKDSLIVKEVTSKKLNNISSEFKDCLWIQVCDKLETNSVTLGVIYRRPSNRAYLNGMMLDMVKEACKNDKILLIGDFNFKEIDWKNHMVNGTKFSEPTKFYDCMQDCYLQQHVFEPTRYRGNDKPSTLDLVFTDLEQTELNSSVNVSCGIGKSDHCVIKFHYFLGITEKEEPEKKDIRYNYYRADYKKMKECVAEVNWKEVLLDNSADTDYKKENINEIMDRFYQKINEIVEKTVPKYSNDNKSRRDKPPWLDKKTQKKIRKKYFCWKRYKDTPSYGKYLQYIKCRDQTTKDVRNAKREYENKLAKECKSNPKAFHRYCNFKQKTKKHIIKLRNNEGNLVMSEKENANMLNEYFQSVFNKEEDSPELILNQACKWLYGEDVPKPFDFNTPDIMKEDDGDITVSVNEIIELLALIDPNKSSVPPCIHPRIPKELPEEVAIPVHVIFQCSLDQGQIPDCWKQGVVSPLYKNGDRHDRKNYRPVTITSVLCRVLEKIMRKQILFHLENNNIITKHQHGFTKRKSCETNLLESYDFITDMIDKGMAVDEIFLDLAKAFDKVPCQRLMFKLKEYGLNSTTLNWIESFISGRSQVVRIKGAYSRRLNVWSGVPQGSVLGPVLFTLFINDLLNDVVSLGKIFADDTKLIKVVDFVDDADVLQRDLNRLCEWCKTWKMEFNTGKCKVMHYGANNNRFLYHMEGNVLETTKEEKDLGVYWTDDLKPKKQIRECVTKAYIALNKIRKTFSFMNKDIFLMLYKTFVRPLLEYCQTVWSPYLTGDMEMLESVQRRATKIVPEIKDLTYEERLSYLGLFKLSDRRLRGDMIFMYKMINGMVDLNFSDFFVYSQNPHGTRGHNQKIQLGVKPQTNMRKNFFTNRCVIPWNQLPTAINDAKTIKGFKCNYDRVKLGVN